MQSINIENSTIDKLSVSLCEEKKILLSVLRLDKIHPVISGNKWFKLRYYLEDAVDQKKRTIVTFGGAWSNHIVATAAACKLNGLNSIGLIRGEECKILSPTLEQAKGLGMQLIFLTRHDYKHKLIPSAINKSDYYYIDEGGFGKLGAKGAATILNNFHTDNYTHICCAGGTGTMAAGLLNGIVSQGAQRLQRQSHAHCFKGPVWRMPRAAARCFRTAISQASRAIRIRVQPVPRSATAPPSTLGK
jgi:1-aminocyclopropane-1-carboxylate deaminase